MNELKPKDVTKALECCNTIGNCNQCPYEIVGEYTPCYSALTQDALALLREKDAEIERLSHQCFECAGCTKWKCDCSNIRAEVISEFAERLKRRLPIISPSVFDKIAKEMKGEYNDSVSESKD